MIAQVVTTGRVMATGPRWNRIALASGDDAITLPFARRATQATRANKKPRNATSSGSAPILAAKPRNKIAVARRPTVRTAGTRRPCASGIEIDRPSQHGKISQAEGEPGKESSGGCKAGAKVGIVIRGVSSSTPACSREPGRRRASPVSKKSPNRRRGRASGRRRCRSTSV